MKDSIAIQSASTSPLIELILGGPTPLSLANFTSYYHMTFSREKILVHVIIVLLHPTMSHGTCGTSTKVFACVKERIWMKVQGWTETLLALPRKEVLIMVVDYFILTQMRQLQKHDGVLNKYTLCWLVFGGEERDQSANSLGKLVKLSARVIGSNWTP